VISAFGEGRRRDAVGKTGNKLCSVGRKREVVEEEGVLKSHK